MNKTFVLSAVLAAGVFSGVSAAEGAGAVVAGGAVTWDVGAANAAFDDGRTQMQYLYSDRRISEDSEPVSMIGFLGVGLLLCFMDRDGQFYEVLKDSDGHSISGFVGAPLAQMNAEMRYFFSGRENLHLPQRLKTYVTDRYFAEKRASLEGCTESGMTAGAAPTWDVAEAFEERGAALTDSIDS